MDVTRCQDPFAPEDADDLDVRNAGRDDAAQDVEKPLVDHTNGELRAILAAYGVKVTGKPNKDQLISLVVREQQAAADAAQEQADQQAVQAATEAVAAAQGVTDPSAGVPDPDLEVDDDEEDDDVSG